MIRSKRAVAAIIPAMLLLSTCNSSTSPAGNNIDSITGDLDLYDGGTWIIDSDIDNITGSICIGGNTTLQISNATLTFALTEDLQYGIYLEDNARIEISSSTIQSADKMWEFELRDNAVIEVSDSYLINHSAVKLFDNTVLTGANTLIEELRMDNHGAATINNCEIYPNMQFFFSPGSALEFPDSYTPVNYLQDYTALGGWKLDMTASTAQGWQVDVKPLTDITIQNSEDVTLALWSDGSVSDSIHLVNPDGIPTSFTVTEFGSIVNVVNTEVYFINMYLKDNDNLIVTGEESGGAYSYNTKFLEIVLSGNASLTLYNSHVFGQLFHTNGNATVTVHNCLIGSDDPEDPINSELGIKDNARGYAFDCDISNSDIVINGTSILELTNCIYDSSRVYISDQGQLIVH